MFRSHGCRPDAAKDKLCSIRILRQALIPGPHRIVAVKRVRSSKGFGQTRAVGVQGDFSLPRFGVWLDSAKLSSSSRPGPMGRVEFMKLPCALFIGLLSGPLFNRLPKHEKRVLNKA